MRLGTAAAFLTAAFFGVFGLPAVDAQSGGSLSETARIDAVVTDKAGQPLGALGAEDFEVLEDGAARPIQAVRFLSPGSKQDQAPASAVTSRAEEQEAAANADTRLLAIFWDDYHVSPGDGAARARELLEKLVNSLHPRDLLIVAKPLDSLTNLRATRDRGAALTAIAALDGRMGDYVARNSYEANYIASDPSRIDVVRTQIVSSALNALSLHLGALGSQRKTIVVVSEGFAAPPRRHGGEVLPGEDAVVRSANRGGVAIYALDPSAMAGDHVGSGDRPEASGKEAGRQTLVTLADQTDGAVATAPGQVGPWLSRLMGDLAGSYLIEFQPAHGGDVGAFHPVQVRVRRAGATVHARTGYWTHDAADLLVARLAADAALPKPPTEPPLHTSQVIRPWFGQARGDDGKMRVTFVWQPIERVPGDLSRARSPVVVAMDVIKSGVSVFEARVKSSAPGTQGGGDPDQAVFDVPPGRIRVRMTIEDQTARTIDVDTRDVTVGAMSGSVALGTVQIFRAQNAREYRELAADPQAAPVAGRDFIRSDRLLVRVPAYAAGAQPTVSARLESRASVMRELAVSEGPAADTYQIDLPLASLARGEYAIEVTAVGAASRTSEKVEFRVTP